MECRKGRQKNVVLETLFFLPYYLNTYLRKKKNAKSVITRMFAFKITNFL